MKIIFIQSSLGKKYVMAVTGFLLVGFVIVHLIGNLQIFIGPNPINTYGHFLQHAPEVLWPMRLGLLAIVLLHIASAIALTLENRAARPVPYGNTQSIAASYASRTMFMSGLIISAFIIYHLLHFTVQVEAVNLTGRDFHELRETLPNNASRHDVYGMMLLGFSNVFVSGFYLLGVGLLCLHLSHGISSMFQSIGWKNKRYGRWLDPFACWFSLAIFLGYSAIPVAVLLDRKLHWIQIFP